MKMTPYFSVTRAFQRKRFAMIYERYQLFLLQGTSGTLTSTSGISCSDFC